MLLSLDSVGNYIELYWWKTHEDRSQTNKIKKEIFYS